MQCWKDSRGSGNAPAGKGIVRCNIGTAVVTIVTGNTPGGSRTATELVIKQSGNGNRDGNYRNKHRDNTQAPRPVQRRGKGTEARQKRRTKVLEQESSAPALGWVEVGTVSGGGRGGRGEGEGGSRRENYWNGNQGHNHVDGNFQHKLRLGSWTSVLERRTLTALGFFFPFLYQLTSQKETKYYYVIAFSVLQKTD